MHFHTVYDIQFFWKCIYTVRNNKYIRDVHLCLGSLLATWIEKQAQALGNTTILTPASVFCKVLHLTWLCLTHRFISLHLLSDGGRRGWVRLSRCQDTGGTLQRADRTHLCAATWDRRCELVPWLAGAWALWDPRPQTEVSFWLWIAAGMIYIFFILPQLSTVNEKHPFCLTNILVIQLLKPQKVEAKLINDEESAKTAKLQLIHLNFLGYCEFNGSYYEITVIVWNNPPKKT